MKEAFKKSFVWAAIALAVSVVGVVLVANFRPVSADLSAGYLASDCSGKTSNFKKADLFESEKKSYSSNAGAFEVIDTTGNKFRIVSDYSLNDNSQGKSEIETKAVFSSQSDRPVKFDGLNIDLIFAGGQKSLNLLDKKTFEISAKESIVNSKTVLTDFPATANLLLRDGSNCLTNVPSFIYIKDKNQGADAPVVGYGLAGSNQKSFKLLPGFNLSGFDNPIDPTPFNEKNISILSYGPKGSGWVSKLENNILEPSRGYYLYNPGNSPVELTTSDPYRIPQDFLSPSVRAGWNLLYNPQKEVTLNDYRVRIRSTDGLNFASYSLAELIDKSLAAREIYSPDKNDISANFIKNSTGKISPNAIFWFYLFTAPEDKALTGNSLTISLSGGGDSVAAGQTVNLKLIVTNSDTVSHFVDGGAIDDACQFGLVATDDKGATMGSDYPKSYSACPSWPDQVEILPKAKKEYNLSWKVLEDSKGKVLLNAYFNYSRLLGLDNLTAKTEIFVK